MNWHADDVLLDEYLHQRLGAASTASVEAHLLECAACRHLLADADATGRDELESAWNEIVDAIDQPSVTILERLLGHLGITEPAGRLITATPALWAAFGLAVIISVGLGLVLAGSTRTDAAAVFLALAPIAPVVGVALSFGPRVDPTYEVGAAAPLSGLRLILVRTIAVTATATAICLLGSLAFADRGLIAAAWLLPALALAVATLALSTWVSPWAGGIVVSSMWLGFVFCVGYANRDPLAGFGVTTQIAAGVILAAGTLTFLLRASRLDHREA